MSHATNEATSGPQGRPGGARLYSICGLGVHSDVPLPIPEVSTGEELSPVWVIRWGKPADRPTPPRWQWPDLSTPERQVDASPTDGNGVAFQCYSLGPEGVWLWWDALAAVHIAPNARSVEVYPEPGADPRMLGFLLAGPVTATVLGQLGHPLLHASAVVTPAGTVAFLGGKGRGKSTMAAAFIQRGAALLTDDMLLLRMQEGAVYGVPGPAIMKVWKPTAEHTLGLAASTLPNITATIEKKLVSIDERYAMAQQPAVVRALYVLDRYDDSDDLVEDPTVTDDNGVGSRALPGPQALAAVIAQAYGPLLSTTTVAKFLPTFSGLVKQASVRILRYPSRFDRHDAVYRWVMQDLEDR